MTQTETAALVTLYRHMTITLAMALAHVDHYVPDLDDHARASWAYDVRDMGIAVDPTHCAECARQAEAALADDAAEAAAERWAEGAWLRAAEAGTPETWADEERDRMIDALGYGPPC